MLKMSGGGGNVVSSLGYIILSLKIKAVRRLNFESLLLDKPSRFHLVLNMQNNLFNLFILNSKNINLFSFYVCMYCKENQV